MVDKNAMLKFYETNKDFKRYIDECVKTYGKDKFYMLETRIAEEYYLSLQKGGCNNHEDVTQTSWNNILDVV